MKKIIGVVVILISLVAAFFITRAIIDSWPIPPLTPVSSALGTTTPSAARVMDGSMHPPISGEIFAFMIVIAVLIIIAWWVYREHKDKADKWHKVLKNNATMTFLGLIVLNAVAYILLYEGWKEIYNTGSLFWMTNIGIILFVYLYFEESKAATVVAAVLALIIVAAWIQKYDLGAKDRSSATNKTPITMPNNEVISIRPGTYSEVMGPMNQLKGLMDSSQHVVQHQQQENGDRVITAPADNWSGVIFIPKDKPHVLLDGGGKKFCVRWDARFIECSPQEDVKPTETPEHVYAFQVKSRELDEPIGVTVKFSEEPF